MTKKKLSLKDMDLGLFVSYELSAGALTTKLFRIITLNKINLSDLSDFRRAEETDIGRLTRVNWFSRQKKLYPIYTLKSTRRSPRKFMRLDRGSHIDMQKALGC
jgi:hypothetical protein